MLDQGSSTPNMRLWNAATAVNFEDPDWQERNSVRNVTHLRQVYGGIINEDTYLDIEAGLRQSPMTMRITPYILSVIDTSHFLTDPVRRQFIPLASEFETPHPRLLLDSLDEQGNSQATAIIHRYPDKALFLSTQTCPVYCRFCTRSYAVGPDVDSNTSKLRIGNRKESWQSAFKYLEETACIEDVTISGGDAGRLKAEQLTEVGERLLAIDHIRRIRFATKCLSVLPMKISGDRKWLDALSRLRDGASKTLKEVCLHTHINHPRELSGYTTNAASLLCERGITVRNQSVLLRGVNDNIDTLVDLIRKLGNLQFHPYYIYACDLVNGIEDMRVSLDCSIKLDKALRGATAGFNTPTMVVDLPGGGGKRIVHSYETYDRDLGLALYLAPAVRADEIFAYFDPLRCLSIDAKLIWADPRLAQQALDTMMTELREKVV